MYEECKKCKHLTIEKKSINSELQEYSFTKFLEQYFYNPEIVVQHTDEFVQEEVKLDESSSSDMSGHSESNCEHKIHRDLIRTFVIGGYKIKMKYRKIDNYSIDIVKFRDIDNTEYQKKLSMEELEIIRENFPVCIKELRNEINKVKSILERILQIMDPDILFNEFYSETNLLISKTETELDVFEKDAYDEIAKYLDEESSNVFELTMLRKKLFIQLFNFICILFKAKRLIKRINEAEIKFIDPVQRRSSNHINRGHRKNEYSSSISKNMDNNDPVIKFSESVEPRALSAAEEQNAKEVNPLIKKTSYETKDLCHSEPEHLSGNLSLLILYRIR
jgi:hypothetical protein